MYATFLELALVVPLVAAHQDPAPPEAGPPAAEEPAAEKWTTNTVRRTIGEGLEMTADYTRQRAKTGAPIVVCMHMAGSSRGEYAEIAPKFAEYNCDVLAVDLRAGGEFGGVTNELAAAWSAAHEGEQASYADAYADVEKAVAWAKELRPDSKVILVGSSYSASLAIVYAGRNPDAVAAVLSFSPGEYFKDFARVGLEARNVKVPTYVTCGNGPKELSLAKPIFKALPAELRSSFWPGEEIPASHGARTLVQEDPAYGERQWAPVLKIVRALITP
jgi:pimeloyl-ACP methyl ester carboxylesterase